MVCVLCQFVDVKLIDIENEPMVVGPVCEVQGNNSVLGRDGNATAFDDRVSGLAGGPGSGPGDFGALPDAVLDRQQLLNRRWRNLRLEMK